MSILIQGMEMPIFEHQSWDIRKGADGKWYMVDTNAETSDGAWHEMIPIPSHGDLIDRYDLKNKEITIDYDEWDDTFDDGLLFVASLIDNAPTIIPAELSKEET